MDYLDYFKNNKGFERFMVKAKEKYQSYGRVTGIITVDNITYEEAVDAYAKQTDTKLGQLITNRELPILRYAKELINHSI